MIPPGKIPELLLPAGGFDAGIAAFEGGADAVYLGFQSFSARRQARNFDEDGYRRLLRLARDEGKRIYAAINTVLRDDEYIQVAELLAFLEDYPPDAVIFQDWGLASLLHERLPGIHLHASTQTAIQTPDAARLAAETGITRIVLPRETSIAELARFVAEAPGLEYEVFVHGALCYSWSGLCLASGTLLGRSGNRGECAQVCRSYYTRPGKAVGYWFSCRDLELVDSLPALATAGAASFKVEGRMKSPEYVHALSRLYRASLDRMAGKAISQQEIEALRDQAHLAFNRDSTPAFSKAHAGESLIDSRFPGHRGLPLGKVVASRNGRVSVELSSSLGLRDGALALVEESGVHAMPPEAIAFSIQEMSDSGNGKSLVTARAGSRVEFASPRSFKPGTQLRRISARDMDRRAIRPETYPLALRSLSARLSIVQEGEGGKARMELSLPSSLQRSGLSRHLSFIDDEILPIALGKNPGGFGRVRELFSESGDFDFRLVLDLDQDASLDIAGKAVPLADLFIPPSLLKKLKNRLYAQASAALAIDAVERKANLVAAANSVDVPSLVIANLEGGNEVGAEHASLAGFSCPPRAALRFDRPELSAGMPYALAKDLKEGHGLPIHGNMVFLPLAPVVRDWEEYEVLVTARVRFELAAGRKIMVGIGGLHHAAFAHKLADLDPEGGSLGFFGDIHLYISTMRMAKAWKEFLPSLRFAYRYVDDGRLPDNFEPPLFISKGCYLRHAISGGVCPPACSRSFSEEISDRDRRYIVVVEDCVTMLFRKPEHGHSEA